MCNNELFFLLYDEWIKNAQLFFSPPPPPPLFCVCIFLSLFSCEIFLLSLALYFIIAFRFIVCVRIGPPPPTEVLVDTKEDDDDEKEDEDEERGGGGGGVAKRKPTTEEDHRNGRELSLSLSLSLLFRRE